MTYRWFIEPREPIVVRDGRSAAALDSQSSLSLPLPNTIAGLIRTCFVDDPLTANPAELLQIRIDDGPWFGRHTPDGAFEAWVPAPSDAVWGEFGGHEAFHRAELREVGQDEVVLAQHGVTNLRLVQNEARDHRDRKTKPASDMKGHRFWSLERAIRWATSSEIVMPSLWGKCDVEPIEQETRIHVSIDDVTGTAEAGMLYGTPGLRFAEGFGFAIEVGGVPQRSANVGLPRIVHLGGEGRISFRRDLDVKAMPRFDDYLHIYEDASTYGIPTGLRLQLLTPAWLSPDSPPSAPGWLPSWHQSEKHPDLPAGVRLRLIAASLSRVVAISGWDMQWQGKHGTGKGGPRAVRRLAPAGSVFYFELLDANGQLVTTFQPFIEAARALWGRSIEPAPAQPGHWPKDDRLHLAPPAHDGFGRILPGFFWTSNH